MSNLNDRLKEFEKMASDIGMTHFPIEFEIVPQDVMLEVVTYALPARARHWVYGQSYDYQKHSDGMGYSKIYEVIMNNDPSYAFMLDSNSDTINTMVMAHCFGHCLTPDTYIETSYGSKRICDIKVGEMVLTHSGELKSVIASGKTGEHSILYSIRAKGYEDIICTAQHPIYVQRNEEMLWIQASEVVITDMVVMPRSIWMISSEVTNELIIPIKVGRTTTLFKKNLYYKYGGYRFNLDHDGGRFIGLFLAEGYASESTNKGTAVGKTGFCFHTKETEYHEFVRKFIEKNFFIAPMDSISDKTHSHQIISSNKDLTRWCAKNFGVGSDNKVIPEIIINNKQTLDFYTGLIRGLFEGDGCIFGSNRSLNYTTTSRQLAYQLKRILCALGVKASLRSRQREGRKLCFELSVSGKDRVKIMSWMKIDNTYHPKRTWSHHKIDDNFIYHKIDKISRTDHSTPQPVYNIEVEGDHSFVTSNGITTHNSHCFKNNYLFQNSDRKMVYNAAERAQRIEEYVQRYGIEKVEHTMNMAFAIDKHIDWSKGENRVAYGKPKKIIKEVKKKEFDDLLNPKKPSKIEVIQNANFPPHPESDLLWFLSSYGNLEDWQKDIFEIIRQESFYFYPQYSTKILNEGIASVIHAEFMSKLDSLSPEEHLDFCRVHERVVQPGGNPLNINPYFLGFTILQDIRKRWDNYKAAGESNLSGMEKMIEVVAQEDDISLIKNYLTKELVEEMNLFAYKSDKDKNGDTIITIKSRNPDDVAENLTKDMHNYRSPVITIEKASSTGMELIHHPHNGKTLDERNLSKVMGYIYELWGAPIDMQTIDDQGEVVHHTYDEVGFSGEE
jgi:stage V sporulation protein R